MYSKQLILSLLLSSTSAFWIPSFEAKKEAFQTNFETHIKNLLMKPEDQGPILLQDVEYQLQSLKRDTQWLSYFKGDGSCLACKASLLPIDGFLNSSIIRKALERVIGDLCVALDIYGGQSEVCHGAVNLMADSLLPAVAQGILSPQRVCTEYLHLCDTPEITQLDVDEYVKRILSDKPESLKNNDFVDSLYDKIKNDKNERPTIRQIQMSDPHIDFKYQEGAPTECNFPICCRDNGPAQIIQEGSRLAGKWGDYECDIPHQTLKNMFDFITDNQDTLKVDFLTWTGDNSAHNVWDNSHEEVTEYTKNITQTIKDSLAKTNIQIYPIQGNHDTWPVNVQNFDAPETNYEINHFADSWVDTNWLNEDEKKVFVKYGYYRKPFEFSDKGHVIGVNMQACNDLNWWLLKDRADPGHQLEWLEAQLKEIESEGGFAIMIAHIPLVGCLHQFGLRYKALMERYQAVVRFSYYGHTHDEEIFVTQAINTTQAIGWNLVAASGTSGDTRNPAFTLIEYDKEYMVPTNMYTYYFNLTEANASPTSVPEWKVLHDFKEEYQLDDLRPSNLLDFTKRMYNNATLAGQYEWNKSRRGSNQRPVVQINDRNYLCLSASEIFEQRDCLGKKDIDLKSFDNTDFFNYLIGNWISAA